MRIIIATLIVGAGLLTMSFAEAPASAREPAGELRRGLAEAAFGREGGQQPADDPRFTGISTVMDAKDLTVARRKFEAGARSAWHSHDNGQLIYVESGRARTQKRGQAMREMGPGESDYTGPRVEHWHGAAPKQEFIQVNVGFGGETRWLQKTTDDEYNGKK